MNKQVLNSSGPMLPNTEHYVNHGTAHRVCWKLTSGMNKNEYVGHNPEISWSWPFYEQLISTTEPAAVSQCPHKFNPGCQICIGEVAQMWSDNGVFLIILNIRCKGIARALLHQNTYSASWHTLVVCWCVKHDETTGRKAINKCVCFVIAPWGKS